MMFADMQILSLIASLVAISAANPLGNHYGGEQSEGHDVYHHAHPKYHYDYAVHDLHTGDVKNKWETRDGDVVKGYYSLNEPDGTIRKVEYTADKHNGFNAVVKRLGKSYHPEPVKHQLNYGGHNSFAEGNLGGYASTGAETFGSGGNHEASSYSNGNLHSFGLHGGYH